jgi:RNA polymerase sigma-70 factor (ECF subfamily)
MIRYDEGSTSLTLLNRLGNWRDDEAWQEFVARYDAEIRSTCRRYRLDAETTEELCQRVWIDLARRMRAFRYDPGKTFRGWLRRLCRSRAIDLLRKKKAGAVLPLEDEPADSLRPAAIAENDDGAEPDRSLLLRQAQVVQDAVRRRVDESTWQVFWSIAIEGQSVCESAEAAGISYYAAFAAQKRVRRMLREEGEWLMAARRTLGPHVG